MSMNSLKLNGLICVLLPMITPAMAQGDQPTKINCAVRSSQVIELAAPVNGIVKEVYVKPGVTVNAGDKLVRFDSEIAHQDLKKAKQRLDNQKIIASHKGRIANLSSRVSKLKKAAAVNAVSKREVQDAQLALSEAKDNLFRIQHESKLAKVELTSAKLIVNKSTVVSPVRGMIGENIIDPGESPGGKPIATIFVTDPVRVEAFVPASLVTAFSNSADRKLIINSEKVFIKQLKFEYLSPVAEASSNSISAFFSLSNVDILPGSQCILEF